MSNTTTIPKGYKNTAIGAIPLDWEIKKLGELGEIINGLTYSPNDIHNDGILVLRSSNIKDRELIFEDNVYVKADKFNPVQKGDLLICVRNGSKSLIGKNTLITNDAQGMAFGAFMAVFRGNYNSYLYQIFGTDIYQKEIHKNLGATINSINGSDLKMFQFPIPPLPEQQKIAEILSTWDEAITNCKKTIDTLKGRNKGLAQQLLTGKKRNQIQLSKLLIRVKNSLTPEPEKLYRQIGIRSHAKGIFYKEEVTGLSLGNKSVFHIEPDCFILNIVFAWEHAIAKTTSNEFGMIASHRFPMYKPLDDILDLDYLLYFFKSKKGKNLLNLASPGGAGRNKTLGQSEFLKLQIPVPDLKEQKYIAQVLETADQELKSYQAKLEALQFQKKGLMQQLLTGKIRVNVN